MILNDLSKLKFKTKSAFARFNAIIDHQMQQLQANLSPSAPTHVPILEKILNTARTLRKAVEREEEDAQLECSPRTQQIVNGLEMIIKELESISKIRGASNKEPQMKKRKVAPGSPNRDPCGLGSVSMGGSMRNSPNAGPSGRSS